MDIEKCVTQHDVDYLLNDVRYAIKQLSKHQCIERALDALERVEGRLEDLRKQVPAAAQE